MSVSPNGAVGSALDLVLFSLFQQLAFEDSQSMQGDTELKRIKSAWEEET
jgi:hypothetical protein